LFGGVLLLAGRAPAAPDDVDPVVQLITSLLRDADRDMRALGLKQVRGEVPGAAATEQFAQLLPDLPPETQAGLLEALGERGDPVARTAILKILDSQDVGVRAAAVGALGSLGNAEDVRRLAERTAAANDQEQAAARRALLRLRGAGVDEAILGLLKDASPATHAQLLGVLAARNAKHAVPQMIAAAGHREATVRLAALEALRILADEGHTTELVAILKAAPNEAERRQAELTLLVHCSRGRAACVDALLAGWAGSDAPSQIALLHALARAGGTRALDAIVQDVERCETPAVRDEAVRMLSTWNDRAAIPPLVALAETTKEARYQLLAVRGLVRLASPVGDNPADLKTLAKALAVAKRPEEKRLLLGVLSNVPTAESLALAAPFVDDPALAEEAVLAIALIAEKMPAASRSPAKTILQRAAGAAHDPAVQDRIRQLLQTR
jgi:HEAT repeat protein